MKLFMLSILLCFNALSSDLICKYNNSYNSLTIENSTGKKELSGSFIKKDLEFNYYVKNTNKINNLDNYITINNNKGHKITFILKCK